MTRLTLPLADEMARQINEAELPEYPKREYVFLPGRQYRADFAWLEARLIVEVDGGQWVQGTGHNSGTGRERDCTKDAEATLAGWRVMRFPTSMVRTGKALGYIQRYLTDSRAKAARSS